MNNFYNELFSTKNQSTFSKSSDALKDQVILITGASDGIGKQLSIDFAKRGATIIMLGRTQKKLEAIYDLIVKEGGAEPLILPIDLIKLDDTQALTIFNAVGEQFGKLNSIIHCAAVLGQQTPISNIHQSSWQQVMQTNVEAAFILTKNAMRLLNNTTDSSVIFNTSSVGNQGRAYWGAYSVSKFAVEGLAQVLNDELNTTSTTQVFCVNPGATRTGIRAQAYPSENPALIKTSDTLSAIYGLLINNKQRGYDNIRFNADDFLV
ncbi:MAG: YciK family oxidoreductase [Saccharospirillaceae bacterium]|nr:YciK family oxidoreductase [Pseudomonadales bacterium]NRB80150.1 YciK family oxidoreductase [Saccharospirillaceae bacterium]